MSKEKDLYLIYVLKVGTNHRNESIYEFIFSHDPNQIDELEWKWDEKPANLNAEVPEEDYIDDVKTIITSKLGLKVLHESENFCYLDGFDKVIALAWEDYDLIDEEDTVNYGVDRLVFHYGDALETVENKLYKRDIVLKSK